MLAGHSQVYPRYEIKGKCDKKSRALNGFLRKRQEDEWRGKKKKEMVKRNVIITIALNGGSGSFIRLVIKVALCPLSKIISGGWQFDEKEG